MMDGSDLMPLLDDNHQSSVNADWTGFICATFFF